MVFDSNWQVVVASLGQQSTKVEKWGLGKLVVKQVILDLPPTPHLHPHLVYPQPTPLHPY